MSDPNYPGTDKQTADEGRMEETSGGLGKGKQERSDISKGVAAMFRGREEEWDGQEKQ